MLTLNRIQSRSGKQNCFFFLMCLLVSFAGIMPVRSQEKTKMVTLGTEMLMKPKTPVIGANVYIKGSTKGVSTKCRWEFHFLQEYLSDRLSLSLSLLKDYQVRLKGGEKLRISLEPDAKMLEEVVVVPYGGPVARKDLPFRCFCQR